MDEEKQESKKQSRTFSVILYPDSETYNHEEVLAAACEYFPEWAYIFHDKDVLEDGSPKKPHYHFVGRMKDSRTPQIVANKIGIEANYVQCRKGYTFKKGVRYLCHLDDPKKAQYDGGLISSNIDCSVHLDPYNAVSQGQAIFQKITTECITDIEVLAAWAFREGCYAELRRGYGIWRDLVNANKNIIEKERTR